MRIELKYVTGDEFPFQASYYTGPRTGQVVDCEKIEGNCAASYSALMRGMVRKLEGEEGDHSISFDSEIVKHVTPEDMATGANLMVALIGRSNKLETMVRQVRNATNEIPRRVSAPVLQRAS